MPTRAPKICRCGNVVASGETCPCRAKATKERKARSDAKRPSRQTRGYDAEWTKARNDYLAAYPYCRRCGAKASLVHHIVPIRKAPHRRLDRSNFQSLCTACHSGWKQSQDRK